MGVSVEPSFRVGPKGGNLDNPAHYPHARNASFQPSDGEMGLHSSASATGRIDAAIIGRVNEQPWHRMAAYMMLAGRTNIEIAAAANKEPVTVSQLKSQQWFQELLAKLVAETGASIQGLIAAEATASLQKLVSLRDSAESERVQYAAAKDLLEFAHGKATQHIISTNANLNVSATQEYEDLQRELSALRASKSQNV